MTTYVDEKQLEDVLKQFYIVTGLKVTVFDDKHNVLAEYPKEHCAFCSYINMVAASKELCEQSNWNAFDKCKKNRKTYIYKCHVGLVEVAVPLLKNDQIIGYYMFGQITDSKNKDDIKKKLKQISHIIDYDKACELLTSVNQHSLEKIKAEIKIVEVCCMYFILGKMINIKEDLLSNQIIEYIDEHALEKFSVKDLCNYLNFSRTQVYNIFKKTNKIGVMEYVRNIRLKKSIDLLKDGSYSIKEIAYMTGFNDSNHFIKTFKSKYGCSPKKYQKAN